MAFSIKDFKANFEKGGVIHTNKYDVAIYFNNTNTGIVSPLQTFSINNNFGGAIPFTTQTRDLNYRCTDASLPGIIMRTADINRYGVGIMEKMPYSANYTDSSLSFICDKNGAAYTFWYLWFNYIFGATGEETYSNVYGTYQPDAGSGTPAARSFYTTEYKDNYAATIAINVYDTDGKLPMSVNLYKAYPVSISDSALSWKNNNNLLQINVQLTFREWDLNNAQNGSSGSSAQ